MDNRYARIHVDIDLLRFFRGALRHHDITERIFENTMTIYFSKKQVATYIEKNGPWHIVGHTIVGDFDWEYFNLKNHVTYGPSQREEEEGLIS